MAEGRKLGIIFGVTLAVCFGLKYLLPYVTPFLIAALFVRILNPMLNRIRRKLPWKKEVMAGVLVMLFFVLLAAAAWALYSALMEQVCRVISNFNVYYDCVCDVLDEGCCFLEKRIGVQAEEIRAVIDSGLYKIRTQMDSNIIPGMLDQSVHYLLKLAKAAGFIFILFIGIILLIKDYDQIGEKLQQYELFRKVRNVGNRIWGMGGAYLKAQSVIILVIIVLCTVGLYLLGNPYALLLGIVIGLLDALPFLGTGTVLIPWAIVLAIQKNYKTAIGYAVLFLVTNTVREFLEPKLIGSKVGVYPFVIAAVVYAGVCFFGTPGVLLGPVAYLLIRETCKEIFN